MKKIANTIMPLAVLVLFVTCMISGLGLLVVLMSSVDFGGGLPWAYFVRLYLPALSIALPIVGMILCAVVLAGSYNRAGVAVKTAVLEEVKPVTMSVTTADAELNEAPLTKAA